MDTLFKLKTHVPPPTTVALRLFNYCNDIFEANNTSINQSFHRLTKVELIESYRVGSYLLSFFYCYGEIESPYMMNGQPELIKATYKIRVEVYER